MELPRLVGSAQELSACAREWRGSGTLLTGPDLTIGRLAAELNRRPAVVHFATHFLQPTPDNPADVRIALGLIPRTDQPRQELLSLTDLTLLRVPGSLVSLSGCHSAAGLALPGAGLLGLSRAFLAAGRQWCDRDVVADAGRHRRVVPPALSSSEFRDGGQSGGCAAGGAGGDAAFHQLAVKPALLGGIRVDVEESRESMKVVSQVSEFVASAVSRKNSPAPARVPENGFAGPDIDWNLLVQRVQDRVPDAVDQLYRLFARGIRFHLYRQLGTQELDDKVHDTFLLVVEAIQKGDLREPERLMGFVRTIVRRQISVYITENIQQRRAQTDFDISARLHDGSHDPEQSVISNEARTVIAQVLGHLADRDREILTRFYLREQTAEEICAQMNLSETQFRLLKSRAKARFGEIGKKKAPTAVAECTFCENFVDPPHTNTPEAGRCRTTPRRTPRGAPTDQEGKCL